MAVSLAADLTGSDPETSNAPYEIVAFVALSTSGCLLVGAAVWGVLMMHGVRAVKRALDYSTVPTTAAGAASSTLRQGLGGGLTVGGGRELEQIIAVDAVDGSIPAPCGMSRVARLDPPVSQVDVSAID